jgi:hypothetical protein
MKLLGRSLIFAIIVAAPLLCLGQTNEPGPIRSSAAYAEILLRRTEIQADLESFLASYTEAHPKVVDSRVELASLDKSLETIFAVKLTETGKLTLALGKLIVKRAALETEFARLVRNYSLDHPEAKRAKRRVEIFDTAIKEVIK